VNNGVNINIYSESCDVKRLLSMLVAYFYNPQIITVHNMSLIATKYQLNFYLLSSENQADDQVIQKK